MRNLIIVFQSIFEVHFGRCVFRLAVFDVSNGSFTTCLAQAATELSELCPGRGKEGFCLGVTIPQQQSTSFDSQQVGKD